MSISRNYNQYCKKKQGEKNYGTFEDQVPRLKRLGCGASAVIAGFVIPHAWDDAIWL